jgi:hypothetical protein
MPETAGNQSFQKSVAEMQRAAGEQFAVFYPAMNWLGLKSHGTAQHPHYDIP